MLKVILNRLKPQAEKIIAEEQAGFRGGRSTTEQINDPRGEGIGEGDDTILQSDMFTFCGTGNITCLGHRGLSGTKKRRLRSFWAVVPKFD